MFKYFICCLAFPMFTVKVFAQQIPTPQWRPAYHFTPPTGWTNDPNGLIFLDGKYNLYYQHNPFENKWGHMSWGHATSTDLLHWTNLPVAIPEIVTKDTLTYIYSGSAVLDKNNTSGFGKNGKAPIVAIFTADQPKQKKESQYIAYSNDGGISYTQYTGNPVIDLNKKDFRDPNVFWHEPTKQWIMTVAMVDEHMVRIYGSKNLKEWTKLSDFGPAGYTKSGWECPSLLPLTVDGDAANTKWVLFVSCWGEHSPMMQYYVGDFDGTTFKNSNDAGSLFKVDYGDSFYAAIAWRDAPGNRKVLLGWLVNGRKETYPWKGQMSIPHDLSLKTTNEGIRLVQAPSAVVNRAISKEVKALSFGSHVLDGTMSLKGIRVFGKSMWIDVDFQLNDAKKVGFILAQERGTTKKVVVGYDAVKQELFIDCTTSETANKDAVNLIQTAPLKPVNGAVRLQILLDRSSLEVFGNGGEKVISTMIYPGENATDNTIFSEGKSQVKSLKIWDLSSRVIQPKPTPERN
jgi:levanase/fructan beta-fructosidase